MVATVPSGANAASAVSGSRKTTVAPARAAPSPISPTTVTGRTCPPTTTLVASPSARPDAARVADSTAISSPSCGARPATTSTAGSRGS